MVESKQKARVKCEGRFSQLRAYIYENAVPLVLEDRTIITEEDLQNLWDLVEPEIHSGFDIHDPYFASKVDSLRKSPIEGPLSLVPLIESNYHLSNELVGKYAEQMGNSPAVSTGLEVMASQPRDYLRKNLGREPKDIVMPCNVNLAGYTIAANYGIGTISHGGTGGGGVRSDAPFLIEIYKNRLNSVQRGEIDLAAVVGFWPQDNSMLVSQMQSCGNAHLPEGPSFGVSCLKTAEFIARAIGFKEIKAYTARGHPIFKEHPDSWDQFGTSFICSWDCAAKKLGYSGSRNGSSYHVKDLT
jgi:hypothetical protein